MSTEQTKIVNASSDSKYPLWRLAPTAATVLLTAFNLCPLLGECKHRNQLPSPRLKLQAWGKLNDTAKKVALPAIFTAIAFGFNAWKKTEDNLFLFGSIAVALSIPYSFIFIRKSHNELKKLHNHVTKGGYFTKSDQRNVELNMKQWDKWVNFRVVFSAVAAALFIAAEANVLSKDKLK